MAFSKDNKSAFGVLLAVVILLIVILGIKYRDGASYPPNTPPNGNITITGTMECLPHKDTSGPQTMECAFGLRDNNNLHYALKDSDPNFSNVSSANTGDQVTVEGTFERGRDIRYDSVGTITVTSITPGSLAVPGDGTTPTNTTMP